MPSAALRESSERGLGFNAPLTNDGVVDVQNRARELTRSESQSRSFNVATGRQLDVDERLS